MLIRAGSSPVTRTKYKKGSRAPLFVFGTVRCDEGPRQCEKHWRALRRAAALRLKCRRNICIKQDENEKNNLLPADICAGSSYWIGLLKQSEGGQGVHDRVCLHSVYFGMF